MPTTIGYFRDGGKRPKRTRRKGKIPMNRAQRHKAALERKVTGPDGQRRPMSDTSNAVRIMEIATGLREEEYAPGRYPESKKKVRIL